MHSAHLWVRENLVAIVGGGVGIGLAEVGKWGGQLGGGGTWGAAGRCWGSLGGQLGMWGTGGTWGSLMGRMWGTRGSLEGDTDGAEVGQSWSGSRRRTSLPFPPETG